MNRLTGAFFVAAALSLAGCGGGGGGGEPAPKSDVVALATKMINEATTDEETEECVTDKHCIPWPVDALATVPQEDLPADL